MQAQFPSKERILLPARKALALGEPLAQPPPNTVMVETPVTAKLDLMTVEIAAGP